MAKIVKVKPVEEDVQELAEDDRSGDRHIRILLCVFGLYSGRIERSPTRLQALTTTYQSITCALATVSLVLVGVTSYKPGEEFNLTLNMKIIFLFVGVCMVTLQWHFLYKCHQKRGFQLYYTDLSECIALLEELGAQVSTALSKTQYFIIFSLETNFLLVFVWLVIDEILYHENGLTGHDLTLRVNDPSMRSFLKVFGIFSIVNMFSAFFNLMIFYYNSSYTTARLFEVFNQTVRRYEGEVSDRQLRRIRLIYCRLCGLVSQADSIWSPFLGLIMAQFVTTPLLVLYNLAAIIQGRESISGLLFSIATSWVPAMLVNTLMTIYFSDRNTVQVR